MVDRSELQVGTTKQLFLDDLVIDEQRGVHHTLHQPAKYAGNPLMFPLYPWEGRLSLYGNVMRDPDDPSLLRMWYTGYAGMGVRQMGSKDTSKWAHLGFDPNNLLYMYCYATSRDGIFWDRPNLGLIRPFRNLSTIRYPTFEILCKLDPTSDSVQSRSQQGFR